MTTIAVTREQTERAPAQFTAEQARVKAMSNPIRERVLRHWVENGVKAPIEVSHELGIHISNVSYHARVLIKYGCLEEVWTESKRGATKHYLRATERHLVDEPEWEELDSLARDGVVAGSMQPLVNDFEKAAREGVFRDPTGDFILARIPVKAVDEEGYRELMASARRSYDETFEIERRSAERMKTSGEEPIKATAGQAIWRMSGF